MPKRPQPRRQMSGGSGVAFDAEGLSAFDLGNSDRLQVGDYVFAIENPFDLGQTVTSGIFSALCRSGLNIEVYEEFIQNDASVNPGDSGGALATLDGLLVVINTATVAPWVAMSGSVSPCL